MGKVGDTVCRFMGFVDGCMVGRFDGWILGSSLDRSEEFADGSAEGELVGSFIALVVG